MAIAPETARRLACDATVVAIIEAADGSPLDVGRKTRTAPAGLRRALRRRDGGCRFPGCGRRRFLHAHHIRHWTAGGETKLANLVLLLCSRHHRLVHEGGYRLESPAHHVFVFHDDAGRLIPEAVLTLIEEWRAAHIHELHAAWSAVRDGRQPGTIDPLP